MNHPAPLVRRGMHKTNKVITLRLFCLFYICVRIRGASILPFQFRYDIDTIVTKYCDIDIDIDVK